jgi:hypothetical protein
MRPPNDELISAYKRDLQLEIEANAREQRPDLADYDRKCRTELAALEQAERDGVVIGIDDFGVPSVEAGTKAQRESIALLAAVICGSKAT